MSLRRPFVAETNQLLRRMGLRRYLLREVDIAEEYLTYQMFRDDLSQKKDSPLHIKIRGSGGDLKDFPEGEIRAAA